MLPMSSEEVFHGPEDHRLQMSYQYNNICQWADKNSELLHKIPEKISIQDESLLEELFEYWMDTFLTDFQDNHTLQMHIFVELSRTCFLLSYNQLIEERKQLQFRQYPSNPQDYMVLWKPNEEADEVNVFAYKQSQIMASLLEITMKIVYSHNDNQEWVRQYARYLMARNGLFLCQSCGEELLDVPHMRDDAEKRPNVDYLYFCTFYFQAIFRRLLYDEVFSQLMVAEEVVTALELASVTEWFEQEVCPSLGEEGFSGVYKTSCEQAYVFPGDLEWFSYRNPGNTRDIGTILGMMRKPLADRFFSENRISLEVVLATMNSHEHQGNCSRLFLLYAVHQYLKTFYGLDWMDGVLIRNEELETCEVKFYRPKCPAIVQRYSLFEVYHQKRIYPTTNIYATLAIWFKLVEREYQGRIFGYDLRSCINKALNRKTET